MNWKNSVSLLLFVLLAAGCKGKMETETNSMGPSEATIVREATSKYLIEAEDLLALTHRESVKIIDFRKEKTYAENHIDGAINLWRDQIEDHTFPYNGMMAKADSVAILLGRLGISDTDQLIVYDDLGSCDAARFWWVMQNYDFENVKILNGGLKAWIAAGGRVNTKVNVREASIFQLSEKPSYRYLIDRDAMQKIVTSPGLERIIDTRTLDEYSGKRQKAGASYGGRIPGSQHIEWTEAIDYHGTLKFKSKDELEKIYGALKTSPDDPIIAYCHTGVRSALTTFVLTQLLDYKNVKNYDGSWSEWSFYDDQPFEKDSITTILK